MTRILDFLAMLAFACWMAVLSLTGEDFCDE